MSNRPKTIAARFALSPVKALAALAVFLTLTYVALIAVVMNYAALTVEFAESARDKEASLAALENTYFSRLELVTNTNYVAAGYDKPVSQTFVSGAPLTALR